MATEDERETAIRRMRDETTRHAAETARIIRESAAEAQKRIEAHNEALVRKIERELPD